MLFESNSPPVVNPLAVLGGLMFILTPVLLSFDAGTPLLALGIALPLLLALKPDLSRWLAVALPVVIMSLGMGLINLIFTQPQSCDPVMFSWGPITLTPRSYSRAAATGLRSLALGLLTTLAASTFGPLALVRSLIHQGRLPPRWGFAIYAGLNSLPSLLSDLEIMNQTKKIRLGGRSRFKDHLEMPAVLLAAALRRAERIAFSMSAREVESPGPRTYLVRSYWTGWDSAALTFGFLVGCLVFILSLNFGFFGFDLG